MDIRSVIENDYCIGCGVCVAAANNGTNMKLCDDGFYRPESTEDLSSLKVSRVCPHSDDALSESQLSANLFPEPRDSIPIVGRFEELYVGYVLEGDFRANGSSGGMGSWILYHLLESGAVDNIIAVTGSSGTAKFSYSVISDTRTLLSSAKSKYYPVSLEKVLQIVKSSKQTFAIIGIPCFIKAIRLLQRSDESIKTNVKYCIGLLCGHNKSALYADSLSWQMGIEPTELRTIDFRVKSNQARADEYSTSVCSDNLSNCELTKNLVGTNWGLGAFKAQVCDFCDDIFNETADMVIGDAWLPEYSADSEGTNIVVVRNKFLNHLVEDSISAGDLELAKISPKRIIQSQSAGIRHKIDCLPYRILKKNRSGQPVPTKRYSRSILLLSKSEQRIQDSRSELRVQSFELFMRALTTKKLSDYTSGMQSLIEKHHEIVLSRVERYIRRIRYIVRGY